MLCDELATQTCGRCAAPLCVAHGHGEDVHCGDCEVEFFSQEARRTRRLSLAFVGGLAAATVVATAITLPVGGWGPAVLMGVFGTSATVGISTAMSGKQRTSRRRRKKFLAERAERFQPMLPSADESE